MTAEEILKEYILTKYKSIREFTMESGIPYSTMATILKRGIQNSGVTNIIRICKALDISADELAKGNIVPVPLEGSDKMISFQSFIDRTKADLSNVYIMKQNTQQKLTEEQIKRIQKYLDVICQAENTEGDQ